VLSTSCQSSSQITAPLHRPSVNSPSNYLIPHTVVYLIYFAPLHPSISTCTLIFCTSITPVFNFYIVIILPLWPIYCLTSLIQPHLHKLYIYFFYCVIDCMFAYPMFNSVLLFVSHCFALSCQALTVESFLCLYFWFGQGVIWVGILCSCFYVFYFFVFGQVWFSIRDSCLSLSLIGNHT
jgi:hypothetical protein